MNDGDDKIDSTLPLYDRTEAETEAAYIAAMLRLHDIGRECCLPAIVEEYDREKRTATVKPIVKKLYKTRDGNKYSDRDSYQDIPVIACVHGNFAIDFPISKGDQGVLIASDRAWSEIFKSIQKEDGEEWDGKPKKPDNESLASFENGVFIPSSFGKILIDKENENDLVIARVDKDGKVDGRIAICDRYVDIDIDTIVHGTMTVAGESRKAIINANDLHETDAKFREVTVVTGFKKKVGKIVKLFAKKFRVLADELTDGEDVEFEVGGGGKKLKLKYGSETPIEYNGEEEKEFSVPFPGNGVLTLSINGIVVATFKANQSTDETFNVSIPPQVVPGDGTLTLQIDGTNVTTFTANQVGSSTFNVPSGIPITGTAPTTLSDDQIISKQRYDYDSHQIQVKVRKLNYNENGTRIISVSPISDWIMIEGGQCVEHQSE